MENKYNKNGVVLWETTRIVSIMTGLNRPSRNDKTGDLLQIFIFYKHELPSLAIKSGNDSVVCGDCKRRPINARENGEEPCYVTLWRGPDSVWRCWDSGGYMRWDGDPSIVSDRFVRFGAYGDPTYIPLDIVHSVSFWSRAHTGYTHQWRSPANYGYRKYFKASVDSESEMRDAVSMGWSTFRVRRSDESLLEGENICPASKEAGFRKKCESCMLCNGKKWNVAIVEH